MQMRLLLLVSLPSDGDQLGARPVGPVRYDSVAVNVYGDGWWQYAVFKGQGRQKEVRDTLFPVLFY